MLKQFIELKITRILKIQQIPKIRGQTASKF